MESPDRNARILGLLVVLLLVGVALLVARHLHDESTLEDCMMQGRANCAGTIAP